MGRTLSSIWPRPTSKPAATQHADTQADAKKLAAAQKTGSFVPVSLAPYGNRDFKDTSEGSTTDGWWTGHGDNDMREFPTGKVELKGVPFDIPVRNGAIMLRGAQDCREFPEKVAGIRIGRKAGVVYFLQASTNTSKGDDMARYVVRYGDGATAEIAVREGGNIADWWEKPCDLPGAEVAWTGKNPMKDKIAVYLLRWLNPAPEKEIAVIDFIGGHSGSIPALIGLTLRTLN